MADIVESDFKLSSDVFIVRVGTGPGIKQFTIHKNLLFEYSEYFKRAFGGTGTFLLEAHTKVAELEESDPGIFSFVFEWLYTQDIKQTGDIKKISGDDACKPTAITYTDIWKLADYLDMPKLCNFVMTRLYEGFHQTSGKTYLMTHLILPCYEDTLPGTPLRYWISTMYALGVGIFDTELEPEDNEKLLCHEFLVEYFHYRGILAKASNQGPMSIDPKKWKKRGWLVFRAEDYLVGAPKISESLKLAVKEEDEDEDRVSYAGRFHVQTYADLDLMGH